MLDANEVFGVSVAAADDSAVPVGILEQAEVRARMADARDFVVVNACFGRAPGRVPDVEVGGSALPS